MRDFLFYKNYTLSKYADNPSSIRFQHLYDICLVLSFTAKRLAALESHRIKLADRIY